MARRVALACMALLLCACSPDNGFGETKGITSDDYGAAWPLTVTAANLNRVCEGNTGVGLIVEGHEFVIDGLEAPDDVSEAFLPFWAEDTSRPSGRMDLSPLVDDGRELCD